ncbi:MAG TPA: hypothetical protein VLA04_05340 [Verrucomicrobiae bacterium]|nr:hypothetical protein [Verrucomicrobiae bacterium]
MSNVIRIFLSHRGFGSLGNSVEFLVGEASSLWLGNWIEVSERESGYFEIVGNNMTEKNGDWIVDSTALGFGEWDSEVVDLDAGNSDESQCFGISSHLWWNDVDLTPEYIRAPNLQRLREALEHVAFCAWCPGDI